jgi:glycosyltransferase involved in cell wall biosynthesis
LNPARPTAAFIVAGALDQRTGGYIYDAAIIRALRNSGWQIDVLELDGEFPWPDMAAEQSLERALAGIDDRRPVVIDALAAGGLPAAVERHAARLTIVVLVHHPLADETGVAEDRANELLARERRLLGCAAQVVTTSGFTADRLQQLALLQIQAAVVEPGVERPPVAARNPDATCRLLCVATLIPRKGHLVLVEALARCAGLDWVCDCVGDTERDPDQAQAVRRAIVDAGLEDRVRLYGALEPDALAERYAQADVFVLPSWYEGYGMVVTEAIAHGLPVITTTGGALAQTLPSGAGRAVAPGDTAALAEALQSFIGDRDARAGAAEAAARARDALRSWHIAGNEFAAVLERVSLPPGPA